MRKKSVSPETIKTISTLFVAIIFMIIVLPLSSIYTKHMLKNAENKYFDNMETILDGYSSIVTLQLQNYKNSLDAFYVKHIFETEDENEITNFLVTYKYKMNKEFTFIYFLTPSGKAYTTEGTTIQMNKEKHTALIGEPELYISNLGKVPGTDNYTFCIEETIRAKDGRIIGVLGASISINDFINDNINIKLGNKESFMIIDRDGYFLMHQRKEIIGTTFAPDAPAYSNFASINLAKSGPGTFTTKADNGDIVYIMTHKIPETGWTIGLKISLSEIEAIYKPQKKSSLQIVFVSILVIILLVLVEGWIVSLIQKKQLIATVYDPLTNLWTRQRFEIEAAKMIRFSPRSKFMLIEADIRGFKFLNQNYGEEAADKVILYYSQMLNKWISEFKSIIGRGFADHFYILIKITSVHRAMNTFKEKMDELDDYLKSYEIPFFPKFGISFLMPGEASRGITIQGLIGQASFAKSTIKDNMLTQYSVYNSRLLEKINEERFIEEHMQQALDSKEFFVMYQPKISLADERIVGAEALVRWNSPKLGLMTPDKFIPLFERNGFITKLDFFVYEEVFKFLQARLIKGETVVPVSVNMSRNHNKPEKFMHDFLEIFNKYSIPPELVQVEILERSVMDSNTLQDITNKLHKEGFTVAMDDFGSGESSLNMLTKIPVDVLKFDREFLNSSTNSNGEIDSKSAKFIHILIDLSKNLEKQTVFEGVETQAQRDFLRSIECDQAQGFFYSKPLSEQDFIQFIKLHS